MNTAPSEGLLTRAECNALRGLAILGIFLHNYCHWLGPIVKENEFQFFEHNVSWLHRVLGSPDLLLPIHLISFFGHYGVPIFLFLSAYGLERKYAATGSPLHIYMSAPSDGTPVVPLGAAALPSGPGVLAFVRYHYLKLFKMMIVGFVCFTVVDAITPSRWGYSALQVVAQRDANPTHAAVLLSFETVFAAVGGALFLNESLGGRGLFGCCLMFAGMLAAQLWPRKPVSA